MSEPRNPTKQRPLNFGQTVRPPNSCKAADAPGVSWCLALAGICGGGQGHSINGIFSAWSKGRVGAVAGLRRGFLQNKLLESARQERRTKVPTPPLALTVLQVVREMQDGNSFGWAPILSWGALIPEDQSRHTTPKSRKW